MRDVGFYNIQSGVKGRDGGPYLDEVERQRAEVMRARAEDREPASDDNLPAHVGTQLVTAPFVVDNSLASNPSMLSRPGLESQLDDEVFLNNDNFVSPVNTLPVAEDDDDNGEDEDVNLDDADPDNGNEPRGEGAFVGPNEADGGFTNNNGSGL